MVSAHAVWFVEGDYPSDWSFAAERLTLVYMGLAVLLALVVRFASKRWPAVRAIDWLGRLVPWMPFCVRIHVAVALVILASLGRYLTPGMQLEQNVPGYLLGTLELIVAVLFAVGWHTRPAAWLLIVSGPIGLLEFGISPVLQRIDMLGAALFILFTGPGRWSADWELGGRKEFSYDDAARAMWCFRISAGLALVFAAFAEKLANPDISVAFLDRYPRFNILSAVALPVSDLEFTRFAGALEILLGLLLISGAMPQVIMPVAVFPFIGALVALGSLELGGHLPEYAALIAFIVFASNRELGPTVYELWPWRRSQPTTPAVPSAPDPP